MTDPTGQSSGEEWMRDTLIDAWSHDLRAPIAAIQTISEVLLDHTCGELNPRQSEAISGIRTKARELARIVDDVVEYARINSGRATVELLPVEVGTLCAASMAMIRPVAARKGVRIEVASPEGMTACIDARRVKQALFIVLHHLVTSAMVGGRIELRASRSENGKELQFEVSGETEPLAQVPAVDPFEGVAGNGQGPGLRLVRRIADLLGGTASVLAGTGAVRTIRFSVPWIGQGSTPGPLR